MKAINTDEKLEIVKRYFILHNIPEHIAHELANDYDWGDRRIEEMQTELSKYYGGKLIK